MKDLSLSVAGVLVLALGIGLAFHWLYPVSAPSTPQQRLASGCWW